jgi:hypothetical protein
MMSYLDLLTLASIYIGALKEPPSVGVGKMTGFEKDTFALIVDNENVTP